MHVSVYAHAASGQFGLCTCRPVCLYTCFGTFPHIYPHVNMHASTSIHIYAHVQIHACTRIHAQVYAHQHIYVYPRTCLCMCAVLVHTPMYMSLRTILYTCMHAHMSERITMHMSIYTFIPHVCTHAYMCSTPPPPRPSQESIA